MNLRFWKDEKPLRMLWRIEKDHRVAHLIGTAHFFPYSFKHTFTRLLRAAELALFEGPLDEASSARIAEYAKQAEGIPTFVEMLTPEARAEIERLLRARLDTDRATNLYLFTQRPTSYLETFTQGVRPWAAFFAIWQTYLAWNYSMDLEGYRIAQRLGKPIQYLETVEEQLAALDDIPLERIARQFNAVKEWEQYKQTYLELFLKGDLEQLMTFTARFVTRGPRIIGARDRVMFERMTPFIANATVVIFIGFPHIPGVTQLLREAGYTITQVHE